MTKWCPIVAVGEVVAVGAAAVLVVISWSFTIADPASSKTRWPASGGGNFPRAFTEDDFLPNYLCHESFRFTSHHPQTKPARTWASRCQAVICNPFFCNFPLRWECRSTQVHASREMKCKRVLFYKTFPLRNHYNPAKPRHFDLAIRPLMSIYSNWWFRTAFRWHLLKTEPKIRTRRRMVSSHVIYHSIVPIRSWSPSITMITYHGSTTHGTQNTFVSITLYGVCYALYCDYGRIARTVINAKC